MAEENVLIKFSVDYAELDAAIATLEKTGKLDPKVAQSFQQTQKAISGTATDTKGLIKQFKDVATASVKMGKSVEDAFGQGVQDALDEAGVSVQEFAGQLKKANVAAIPLKKELMQLKESLARMKAEGKDTGKEFDALRARAGKLADAIADANAEIKNAGSDTKGIDNVVGSISALAGGYAAVQGAAALFGDENEDLQKALLKVNSAMAIATGTQQLLNAVQKEGSLAKLVDVAATGAQTAAQKVYAFAVGNSTGAMKIFRTVLLGLGIGAIVFVLYEAAKAMGFFSDNTETATDRTKELADEFERLNTALENATTSLNRNADIQIEKLKQLGATEKQIHDQNIKNINDENALLTQGNKERIRLLGVEASARNKFEADGLAAIKRRTLESDNITDGNRKRLEQEVKGLEEISAAFKKIDDNNAAIALKNEQFKTKIAEDGFKKRKEFLDLQAKALAAAIKEAERQRLEANDNGVIANLNRVLKEVEQEKIGFDNKADLEAEAYDQKKKDAEDWDKLWKQFQESLTKSSEIESDKRKKQTEAERAAMVKTINTIVEIATQVSNIFNQLGQIQTDKMNAEIAASRERVKQELEAGIITQKAADARLKRIEQQERIARQKQAEREKKAAVFAAVLAIPKAFLQGLSNGGPVLAAVYAALAAIEAGIIASKPVPRFFKGKKGNYEGPGIVGDMGSELVERNGRMFLYTKPTETYLGSRDKVYTAGETRQIMHNTSISTAAPRGNGPQFDYDRFAKAIPAAGININIDKDGITEWGAAKASRTKYMDKRYSSKR